MNMSDKKGSVLRLIKLGMEVFRAELVVGCTESEIEELENDIEFIRRIKAHEAISEKELLDKLEDAIDVAVDKGSSAAIQWKLERLNPNRWASKELDKQLVPHNIKVELVGRHSNDKDN